MDFQHALQLLSSRNECQLRDFCGVFSNQVTTEDYERRWNYQFEKNNYNVYTVKNVGDLKDKKSLGGSKDLVFKHDGGFRKVFQGNLVDGLREVVFTILFGILWDGEDRFSFPEVTGLVVEDNRIIMDMTKVKGTTATKYFCDERRKKESVRTALNMILQLLARVNTRLFEMGYIFSHADLHANNIYIDTNSDKSLHVSFIDFGMAQTLFVGQNQTWTFDKGRLWLAMLGRQMGSNSSSRHGSKATFKMLNCRTQTIGLSGIRKILKDKVRSNHVHHVDVAFIRSMAKILNVDLGTGCKQFIENGDNITQLATACRAGYGVNQL